MAARVQSIKAIAMVVSLPSALAVAKKLGIKDDKGKRTIRRAWHGRAGIDPDVLEDVCNAFGWDDWEIAVALRVMAKRRRDHKAGEPFDPNKQPDISRPMVQQ